MGLDIPFIDPVAEGMLQGKAGPAAGTLPARGKGAAGAAVRPVAIGVAARK